MSQDPSPLGMLDRRQDRLERRLSHVEDATEDLEAWKEGIRNEVAEWKSGVEARISSANEALNRNTTAMYSAGVAILSATALALLTALILRGVIG